ncbi:hypothetical protein [Mesorhizobium sp. WSM4884]|uniref:hypothetical protein n=1 Tax=Mesorhizobium sp. WSM4884 TaxID=3038542 RepID=UPI0024164639|nr:hypothetical protein [Mesorhizobium sp. WSM4884]MDG4885340.1 hypothetical protein [Mesorhizobium sp. WSM4884]
MKIRAANDHTNFVKLRHIADHVFAWLSSRAHEWASPANPSEFQYCDDCLDMVSCYEGNIRTTFSFDRTYRSYSFLFDAAKIDGQPFVVWGTLGGCADDMTVSSSHFSFGVINGVISASVDQSDNWQFERSSSAIVSEMLDRQLQPWRDFPTTRVAQETKALPLAIIRALVRLGYRSRDERNWSAPGKNIGSVN